MWHHYDRRSYSSFGLVPMRGSSIRRQSAIQVGVALPLHILPPRARRTARDLGGLQARTGLNRIRWSAADVVHLEPRDEERLLPTLWQSDILRIGSLAR